VRRLSNRLSRPAAVLVVGLLLGACAGGGGGANQEDVQTDVETQLAENGYIASTGAEPAEPVEMSEGQAADAGDCVSAGLFDPDDFTEDERDAVVDPGDGTPPDPELAARFQDLVDSCVETVLEVGPSAPTDDDEG
jgi:hypothetical protein